MDAGFLQVRDVWRPLFLFVCKEAFGYLCEKHRVRKFGNDDPNFWSWVHINKRRIKVRPFRITLKHAHADLQIHLGKFLIMSRNELEMED